MNILLFFAGLLSVFTVIGHFSIGRKEYLLPMLKSDFEIIPKKVMHCVFHYVSSYLILSSVFLLLNAFNFEFAKNQILVKFIALNYLLFAIWQIIIALSSDIKNGIIKLFQWVFFLLIFTFSWFGV